MLRVFKHVVAPAASIGYPGNSKHGPFYDRVALCSFCRNRCRVFSAAASPPAHLLPLLFLSLQNTAWGSDVRARLQSLRVILGDSFRFFWQVITGVFWWKDRSTIVTTFPLFSEDAHTGPALLPCRPSGGIWRKYQPKTHLAPVWRSWHPSFDRQFPTGGKSRQRDLIWQVTKHLCGVVQYKNIVPYNRFLSPILR